MQEKKVRRKKRRKQRTKGAHPGIRAKVLDGGLNVFASSFIACVQQAFLPFHVSRPAVLCLILVGKLGVVLRSTQFLHNWIGHVSFVTREGAERQTERTDRERGGRGGEKFVPQGSKNNPEKKKVRLRKFPTFAGKILERKKKQQKTSKKKEPPKTSNGSFAFPVGLGLSVVGAGHGWTGPVMDWSAFRLASQNVPPRTFAGGASTEIDLRI